MSAYATLEDWVDAAATGKRCCGGCWEFLPEEVTEWLRTETPDFLPLKAGSSDSLSRARCVGTPLLSCV